MTTNIPIILRISSEEYLEISEIEKFSGGSGYRSRLSVRSGQFSCSGHPFYFDDLKSFIKNITRAYDKVEGKARLADTHEKDFIEISVQTNGHVSITGFVVQYGPLRQELRFGFECDQTFLPDLLKSLKQIAKDLEPDIQNA
ncbi:MAG TPA: hypothetical protein VGI03_03610 [Verrucomicrobiae bacterium]|jgi:hypothetical protein